jgi:hypothetical protein
MESKTCLPSIKFLLDSPTIDDNHGKKENYQKFHSESKKKKKN